MSWLEHLWPHRFKFQATLRRLKHNSAKVRESADRKLWRLTLAVDDVRQLILAATESYPDPKIPQELLRRAGSEMQAECIGAVEEVYDRLEQQPDGRESALRILADLKTTESLQAFARLLARQSSRTVDLELPLVPITGGMWNQIDENGVVLARELMADFSRFDHIEDRFQLLHAILDYANGGTIILSEYPDFQQWCVGRCRLLFERDMPDYEMIFESERTALPYDDDRAEQLLRSSKEIELLFDLMRFIDASEVSEVLIRGCQSPDWEIQLFAVTTMLSRGLSVSDELLEDLACEPSRLHKLWRMLDQIGRLDHLPREYCNQEKLAEAEMVQWLEFPTEMGRVPEDIELVRVVEVDSSEYGHSMCYFYHFRHSEFLDGAWFLGTAGPYPTTAEPTMGASWTFSGFEECDSDSLDGMIDKIVKDWTEDER